MEYKPLCRERDEIRVISIQPSKSYSSGRTENSWASSLWFEGKEYQCVPAVRIALEDDLVHCKLENVSLQDTAVSHSEKGPTTTLPRAIMLPAWRLQQDSLGGDRPDMGRVSFAARALELRFIWGDFEALSYTWGEENSDGRVVVDRKICHVHKNLEAALRRLRALPETEQGMKYWIDALCINQGDIPERNEEVKRMRSLYEKAWSVVVWLGEESDDSNQACDCISSIGHLDNWVRMQEYIPYVEEIYQQLNWKPLMSILSRSYWNRLWIIQELAMNHQNTLFICGNGAFFRQELSETLRFCKRENLVIQRWLNASSEHSMNEDQGNLFGFFRRILSLVDLDGRRENELAIEDILSLAQEASSKDMRDKIYGIHGLLPTALSSRIQPQYDLSIDNVFQDFSEKLLQECGLESLLSWGESDVDLPSWCVNLSRPLSRCHMQWLRRRNASFDRNLPYTYRLSSGIKYLICDGVVLDTIESVTERSISLSDITGNLGVEQDLEDLQDDYPTAKDEALVDALIETLLLGHPGRSGPFPSFLATPWIENRGEDNTSDNLKLDAEKWTSQEMFWRSVKFEGYFEAFDKFRKANATHKVSGHELRSFFPKWEPGIEVYPAGVAEKDAFHKWTQDGPNIVNDLRLAVISLLDRALANTAKGHLALVPSTAKKSDVIAIVACSFPIVLRPKEQGYEYIGECYLHGFMDGEAFAGDKQPKIEEISIR